MRNDYLHFSIGHNGICFAPSKGEQKAPPPQKGNKTVLHNEAKMHWF